MEFMKKLMHFMFLSCRTATELIEKKLFSELSLREKIQLSLHKSMCKACTKYSKQSEELDHYMKNNITNFTPTKPVSNTSVSDDYKEKIIDSIEE